MHHAHQIAADIRAEATAMSGRTGDLVQRAAMYHHLYDHSGGNHGFPLLAAHGALWASGYFRRGLRTAGLLAAVQGLCGERDRATLMAAVSAFAETFRDINRRVCIETLYIYWLSGDARCRALAEAEIPCVLLSEMDRCHWARANGRLLTQEERRAVFEAFFRWEQAEIVGPAVEAAFANFDWTAIRTLALRPTIRFAYFGTARLPFRDFSMREERIEKGLAAFALAEAAGWDRVETSLGDYGLMPPVFLLDPPAFVEAHRIFPSTPAVAMT